jgi:hypothetical protein
MEYVTLDFLKKNINLLDRDTATELITKILQNKKITYEKLAQLICDCLKKKEHEFSLFS